MRHGESWARSLDSVSPAPFLIPKPLGNPGTPQPQSLGLPDTFLQRLSSQNSVAASDTQTITPDPSLAVFILFPVS